MVTRAPTAANRMHLAASFLEAVTAKYGGSRLGRQELDGEFVLDVEGALWTWAMLEAARAPRRARARPDRGGGRPAGDERQGDSDECGIIVAGVAMAGPPQDWAAEVIADGSLQGASPQAWAERAVELYHAHGADRLVAEVNQGGDLVATLIQRRRPDGAVPGGAGDPRQGGCGPSRWRRSTSRGGSATAAGSGELEAQMAAMTVGAATSGGAARTGWTRWSGRSPT